MPKTVELIEEWDDPAHPGWVSGAFGVSARVTGGRLLIDTAPTYPAVTYADTNATWDLTASAFSCYVEMSAWGTQASGAGSHNALLILIDGAAAGFSFVLGGRSLIARVTPTGGPDNDQYIYTGLTEQPYGRWLRFVHLGGQQVGYDVSTDGIRWSRVAVRTAPADLTALRPRFQAGNWNSEPLPATVTFDHVNTGPSGPPTAETPWRLWDGYREVPLAADGWWETAQPDPLPTLLADVAGAPGLDDTTNDGGHQPLPAIGALAGRTFYCVYDVPDLAANFPVLANVYQESGGNTANGRIGLQLDSAGSSTLRTTYQLPGGSNSFTGLPGFRTVGRHIAAYVLADGLASATVDQDGAVAVVPLTPGTGFALASPSARSYRTNGVQRLLVYPAAHDEATRRQVMGWLARAHGVTLPDPYRTKPAPTARNLVPNPSAEVGTTGWGWNTLSGAASAGVRQGGGGLFGSAFVRMTVAALGTYTSLGAFYGASNATRPPVTPGLTYAAGVWVRTSKPTPMRLGIEWKDAAAASLPVTYGATVAVPANTWTRLTASGAAPASAAFTSLSGYMISAPLDAGDTLDYDGWMMVQGTALPDYADGDTANWSWDGQPHLSTSSGPLPVAGTIRPLTVERAPAAGPQLVAAGRAANAGAAGGGLLAARAPDTVRYGDRLLVCAVSGYTTSTVFSLPAGWTELARVQANGTTAVIGEKVADGTEGRTMIPLGIAPGGVTSPAQVLALTGIASGVSGAPLTFASNGSVRYLPISGTTPAPADGYAVAALGLNGGTIRTTLLYATTGWTELGRVDNDLTTIVVLGRRVTAGEQVQIGWGQDPNAGGGTTANYAGALVFLPAAP